jgi:hypothetical protein
VLDCLVEVKAPFNPMSAVAQMAATLKGYGLTKTTGDKYAAGWVPDAFSKVGITYEPHVRRPIWTRCRFSPAAGSGCSTVRFWWRSSPHWSAARRRSGGTWSTMVLGGATTAATPPPSRCRRVRAITGTCLGSAVLIPSQGIVRVNSILPARTPRRAGAPLFFLTDYRRARPNSTPKIAYTYLP